MCESSYGVSVNVFMFHVSRFTFQSASFSLSVFGLRLSVCGGFQLLAGLLFLAKAQVECTHIAAPGKPGKARA